MPVNDENFFIAKVCDSESATRAVGACARLTRTGRASDNHHLRIAKTSETQAFPANLTIERVDVAEVFCMLISTHWLVVETDAVHVGTSVRQHFLKRDAVFFDVLVYSGCSAFRFPDARNDQAISLTLGGQHG